MKTHFKHFANRLRASVLLCGLLATAARAAEPVEWTARPGDGPKAFARHHGSTLEFRCTFTGFGGAFAPDADLRLWYQTNGMGQAWWSVPASRSNDVLSASWPPTADPGADRISFFFGAPSNAYASAVLRMQSSPGFTPNILQPPVLRLDFDGLEVLNAPWATPADVSTALLAATNYTDAAIRDYAAGNETDPVWSAEKSSYLPKSGGAVTGETSVAGLAITASPGWPEYRILFGPNSLDGTYIYWDDQSGRFATWRTAYGGYRFAMEDDLAAMAQFATDYVNAATNALENAGASKLRNYFAEGDIAFVFGGYAQQDAGPPLLRLGLDGWSSWLFPSCASVTNIARTVVSATAADVISHTNSLFVAAVTNCPVVIATATSADFDLGDYGTYGTVAAALAALAAALAALKRGKLDKSAVIDPSLATIADLGQAADALAVRRLVENINDSIDEATHYAVHIIEAGNDGYQLEDIVDNIIQVGGPEFDGAISLLMPPAVEGRIRDFLVEVDNVGLVAAEMEIPEWGETVAIGWVADDDIEEMLTVEPGTMARFYFSERGVRFVAGTDPQSGEPIELPLVMMRRLDVVSEQI